MRQFLFNVLAWFIGTLLGIYAFLGFMATQAEGSPLWPEEKKFYVPQELEDDLFYFRKRCEPNLEESLVRLSANFTLQEFTHSDTAQQHNLTNTPSPEQIRTIELFTKEVLQPLRDAVGPIRITSGFRSNELNNLVGGARQSAHLVEGGFVAADIQVTNHSARAMEVVKLVSELGLPVSQVILEPSWIHISSHTVLLRGPTYLRAQLQNNGRMAYSCLEWEE